ncbi:Phage capsid family protein [Collinsella intestinalis]|uniref:Phage capsid family protein n=1 Tax=Collinsella intestinalis TaxID=147207 RepID=A0A5K1IT80_9ACTN|nr:phage major capsid protein [Collinsella intestinalis]VWL91667.1 Phage capsid family protein [Collinsella intestinalis]
MKSSIEIHNELLDLDQKIKSAENSFNASEGEEQVAYRDAIKTFQGKKDALNEMLTDVLAAEEKMRNDGGVPVIASTPQPKNEHVDFVNAFLGSRDGFENIMAKYGEKMAFTYEQVMNAADPTYKLVDPKKTSYNLPSNIIEMPMGVIDVISKGTTDSNMEYMIPKSFTNKAAEWTPGTVKAESDEAWDKDEASLFTLAHHMPISKHTAYHYGQLESIIKNDLMYGLKLKEADALLNLDNGATKKGILKKTGIQTYENAAGDTVVDSIRKMKTKSWMATGMMPTHLAVHPLVTEHLDLMKDANQRYMLINVNGKVWGLPVVEDVNLVTDPSSDAKYGALMFNANAATWYTSEADALSIGFVNDQFTRNEYTLLAEGEHLITVQRPKSFVYMADALKLTPAAAAASMARTKAKA